MDWTELCVIAARGYENQMTVKFCLFKIFKAFVFELSALLHCDFEINFPLSLVLSLKTYQTYHQKRSRSYR